jgi:general secretion pathway protein G
LNRQGICLREGLRCSSSIIDRGSPAGGLHPISHAHAGRTHGAQADPPPSARFAKTLDDMKTISSIIVVALLLLDSGHLFAYDRPESARIYKAMADIRAIEAAVNLFNADTGRYPKAEEGLDVLVEPTPELLNMENYKDGGYLDRLPRDPWGNEYQYQCPGVHNSTSFDVWTFGSDGQAGGAGMAEDAGNWAGAFERMQAKERRDSFLWGLGSLALAGFVVGLPLYIVGIALKIRNGSPLESALQGFHLGVQVYLTLIGPFVFVLLMMIFSPPV